MSRVRKTRKPIGSDEIQLKVISYIVVTLFAVVCLFPFLLMISSSFMNEKEIITEGYKLIPKEITTNAYRFLLENPTKIISAYKITIQNVILGTVIGLALMSMAGYVLCRSDFKYRNQISFFIYFTTLFAGGLIPSYVWMVNGLHLKNSIWAMILPGIASPWSIFLMRNFMKAIPDSLAESARIDGADDFRVYWQIYLPLAKPAIATIGLFLALAYWNEWYNAMLYIEDSAKYPLQYFLQQMVNKANAEILVSQGITVDMAEMPSESIKMATAVVATGPIILVYPFVQKYFVQGLTVGAVKG